MRPFRIGLLSSLAVTLDSFFVEISVEWESAGHIVYTAAGTYPEHREFDRHTRIPALTRSPNPRNLWAPRQLRKWVRDNEIDVVVVNTATAAALARASRLRCKVIYFCHGLHWDGSRRGEAMLWRLVEFLLLHNTDGVICINCHDEKWFLRNARRIPVTRLEWGVGLDLLRFAKGVPEVQRSNELLWVGEFSSRKDPAAAIHTLRILLDQGLPTRLTMLGTGALRDDTLQLAERLGVASYVSAPGRADPVPHLASVGALLHTARWEGLPRILLEAIAMECPVVAFSAKGVDDLPVVTSPRGDVGRLAQLAGRVIADGCYQYPAFDRADLSYAAAARSILTFAALVLADRPMMT